MGRRSCAGQRKAAALISQSRRWFYRRVKRAAVRRLFFFLPSSGRLLFNIQFDVSSKVLTRNADIISTIRKCNCVTISSGCFNQSDRFIRSRSPKYFCLLGFFISFQTSLSFLMTFALLLSAMWERITHLLPFGTILNLIPRKVV